MKKALFLLNLIIVLGGCTYVQEATKQTRYLIQQTQFPSQRIYKHMLDRDKFFVFGKIVGKPTLKNQPLAVAALSDTYRQGEIVDVNFSSAIDTYYGLNLPEGHYRLLVLCDLDKNGYLDQSEVVGVRELSVNDTQNPEKVLGHYDIDLREALTFSPPPFHIQVPLSVSLKESVIYPRGTIRSLDDPIFSPQMATLGMYEPAVFLEKVPMMFYALEEDMGYKGSRGLRPWNQRFTKGFSGDRLPAWTGHCTVRGFSIILRAMIWLN